MCYVDRNNMWYPYSHRLHHCCHPYFLIQVGWSLVADSSHTIGRLILDCSLWKPIPALFLWSIKPIWCVIILVSDFWSDSLRWNKLKLFQCWFECHWENREVSKIFFQKTSFLNFKVILEVIMQFFQSICNLITIFLLVK